MTQGTKKPKQPKTRTVRTNIVASVTLTVPVGLNEEAIATALKEATMEINRSVTLFVFPDDRLRRMIHSGSIRKLSFGEVTEDDITAV